MAEINKATLTEADIISKYLLPAIKAAGWDDLTQVRQEVKLRDGKVVVRGQMAARKKVKSADIVLYHKMGLPLAVIEAKANKHEIGKGMQQGLDYARLLDVPFVFASNGDGFVFHDKTNPAKLESEIALEDFPSPGQLWDKLCTWKGYTQAQLPVISQDYYSDGSGKSPRYYQLQAINKTVAAISKGEDRVLLVMATGTGKTYTAFQIIWRLWKAKAKKRILFLADRNILVDQTVQQDFAPFGEVMHKVSNREVKKNYEIYLALYQAVTGREEWKQIYRQFPAGFFDLVVIDECHYYRGIFGSNVAMVLRRLLRLCERYGSAPTVVFASATTAATANGRNTSPAWPPTKPIGANTATSPSAVFVESHEPPMPTSTTATSTVAATSSSRAP